MKQYFKTWWNERTQQEQLILKIGFYALIIFAIIQFGIKPVFTLSQKLDNDIRKAEKELRFNERIISKQSTIQERSRQIKSDLSQIEKGLIPGGKPELAMAELQKIIKQLGSKLELTFQKITPEDRKESGTYSLISLGFPISCGINDLRQFLLDLSTYEKILQLSEFRVRVVSRSDDKMTVHMVVSGFIQHKKENNTENTNGQSEGGI